MKTKLYVLGIVTVMLAISLTVYADGVVYDDFTDSKTLEELWEVASTYTEATIEDGALLLTKPSTGGTTARLASTYVLKGNNYAIEARTLGLGSEKGEFFLVLRAPGMYVRIGIAANGQVRTNGIPPGGSYGTFLNTPTQFTDPTMPNLLKITRSGDVFKFSFNNIELTSVTLPGFSEECTIAFETYINGGEASSFWDWIKIYE